jgi:RimJ/RimL family protein N-acetyltransferase
MQRYDRRARAILGSAVVLSLEGLEVGPFAHRRDYELMADYFCDGDESFLLGMGVDPHRLPDRREWLESLLLDHEKPDDAKDRLYLLWSYRSERIGHSSINKIIPGGEGHIHLHMWKAEFRKAGLGTELVRQSVAYYFGRFRLQKVVSEPFAANPAPNRVLEKLGFKLIRTYRTKPGITAYEQDVNRYELTFADWQSPFADKM